MTASFEQPLVRGVGFAVVMLAAVLSIAGCELKDFEGPNSATLSGTVTIDGSSTVAPISQACAEEFHKLQPDVKVVVGTSGTGGGFKGFCRGETDINDASRPITDDEIELCQQNGVEYVELKVAIDGLSVVVNQENDWCDCLTVEQLKRIWEPGSQVNTWRDVDPSWPDEEIKLYGPDTDSGTFDYFTEVICGESGASRTDFQPSADDNILVRGIAGDRTSLGYFGYAYYVENKDKLKALGVAPGSDPSACVLPTDETILAGKYVPLSRPLFLYVNKKSLKKPEVAAFLEYYLSAGQEMVTAVRYVPLDAEALEESRATLRAAVEKHEG